MPAHTIQKTFKVSRPTDGYRYVADGIFQDQVPADDPCQNFAERGIGVRVGTSRNGNHRRKFRIAKCSKPTGDGGNHKTYGDSGPGTQGIFRSLSLIHISEPTRRTPISY